MALANSSCVWASKRRISLGRILSNIVLSALRSGLRRKNSFQKPSDLSGSSSSWCSVFDQSGEGYDLCDESQMLFGGLSNLAMILVSFANSTNRQRR
jgi:hypothetical protein